jgi:hypothetical protein
LTREKAKQRGAKAKELEDEFDDDESNSSAGEDDEGEEGEPVAASTSKVHFDFVP